MLYLQIINSINYCLVRGFDFEKAYSLYRLNRTDEASEVLESVENPDPRVKELFAQVVSANSVSVPFWNALFMINIP